MRLLLVAVAAVAVAVAVVAAPIAQPPDAVTAAEIAVGDEHRREHRRWNATTPVPPPSALARYGIYFAKMHKIGGTTTAYLLHKACAARDIPLVYTHESLEYLGEPQRALRSFPELAGLPHKAQVYRVLQAREPVDRFLSKFFFDRLDRQTAHVDNEQFQAEFHQVWRREEYPKYLGRIPWPPHHNRTLLHVDELTALGQAARHFISMTFDFIGTTEDVDTLYVKLALRLGWDLDELLYVRLKEVKGRPVATDFDPDIQSMMANRLRPSTIVYNQVIELAAAQDAQYERAFPEFRATVAKFKAMLQEYQEAHPCEGKEQDHGDGLHGHDCYFANETVTDHVSALAQRKLQKEQGGKGAEKHAESKAAPKGHNASVPPKAATVPKQIKPPKRSTPEEGSKVPKQIKPPKRSTPEATPKTKTKTKTKHHNRIKEKLIAHGVRPPKHYSLGSGEALDQD